MFQSQWENIVLRHLYETAIDILFLCPYIHLEVVVGEVGGDTPHYNSSCGLSDAQLQVVLEERKFAIDCGINDMSLLTIM